MVKENTVACKHVIGFSVVYSDPVGVKLGCSVRALRIKRSLLTLRRCFRDSSKQLRGGSLIISAVTTIDTNCFEKL